jgi:hypothetical protein
MSKQKSHIKIFSFSKEFGEDVMEGMDGVWVFRKGY